MSATSTDRAERRVLKAAKVWFDSLKPLGWPDEKHLHAPACNTTTDEAEALARAVAAMVEAGDA